MTITATEFKAKCLALLDEVNRTGKPLIILKRGRRVASVVPASEERPWLALQGTGRFTGDPFAPVIGESEIQALR